MSKLWAYLLVYDKEVGTYKEVREFLQSRPEIVDWYGNYLPNSFLLVSGLTAEGVTDLILNHLSFRRGRFIVLDTHSDKSGWLPKKLWDVMREPSASQPLK